MRGEKLFFCVLFILLIILPITTQLASAISGKTTLLAVAETEGGILEGRTATLTLEIKEGSGQVFISTFPFSKVDTQVSTRFARDIACQYLDKDCSKLDFFYTIKATGAIIAGPSAGAATTALTIALLEGKQLDEKIALTGTINSGGVVGHVGGVKQKTEAAVNSGLEKVLIPLGEGILEENNETIDLFNYSRENNAELIEVSDMDDVLYEFGIIKKKPEQIEFDIDESYSLIMGFLAMDLCNRTRKLDKLVEEHENIENYLTNNEFMNAKQKSQNLINKSEPALEEDNFYSAASYCYGANVHKSFMLYLVAELKEYDKEIEKLRGFIEELGNEVEAFDKKTINDLEAYMAVKERLSEGEEFLNNFEEQKDLYLLSYAKERIYSAYSWRTFLNNKGRGFEIDKDSLKKSCENIIGEAREKYQYLDFLFPTLLGDIKQELDKAIGYHNNSEFELCLFTASKAKAKANVLLTSLNVGESNIPMLIEQKINVAKKVIAKEAAKDIFPILGYSYYEYAQNIKDDHYSALLYAEYALELSNLDLYFRTEDKFGFFKLNLNKEVAFSAIAGFFLGVVVVLIFLIRKRFAMKPRKRHSTKKGTIGGIRFKRG